MTSSTHQTSGVSNATPHVMRATMLLYMQDRQGLCIHGNSPRETPHCKHRGGKEVCITSELLVDDTFTSISVGCAAVVVVIVVAAGAGAVGAAAAAAVKTTFNYVGMNAE